MKGIILGLETESGKVIILGHDDKRYNLQKIEWKSAREPKVGMTVDFVTTGEDLAREAYYIPTTLENRGVAEFAAKVGESAGQTIKQVDAIAVNTVENLKEFRKRQGEREKEIIKNVKQKFRENIGLCCFFLLLGVLFIFWVLYESLSSQTRQNAVPAPPVAAQTPPVTVPTLPPEDADILVSSDLATVDLGTLSDFLNSMTGDTTVKIECKKYVSKPDEQGDQAMGFSNFGYVISQFLKEPNDQFLTRFDFDVAGFSGQAGKIFVVNTIRYYNSPSITESNKLVDVLGEDWGEGIGINDSWAKDVLKIHRKKE